MKEQSYITILLIVLMSMTGAKTFAHDIAVKNADGVTIYYKWSNNNHSCLEVSYRGSSFAAYSDTYSGNVIIPNSVEYNGKTYSVIDIGWGAFSGCSNLTSVTIPNSVTFIDNYAFPYCSGLSSIVLESGNTKYDSRDNCNAIIETASNELIVGCKNSIIPNSVTSIGSYAFSGRSGLTSITIPNGVTLIGGSAFDKCSDLTSVTIPNSVISIERDAFCGCSSLSSLTIGNGVTSIGSWAFSYCSSLTSVTIPNSVTSIGIQAFLGCTNLVFLTIPNSLTSIGTGAFHNTAWYNGQPDGWVYAGKVIYEYKGEMPANTELLIKDGILGIAGSAFNGCNGLTSVTIPNSLISIEGDAFINCNGIKTIIVESGNTKYDSRDNCNAIIETESNKLISGCKNTIIPNSVISIVPYSFSGCSGLKSITIPNSVTSIGSFAFLECSSLTSITIPNRVTFIGSGVFRGCSGLTSVVSLNKEPVKCDDMNIFYDVDMNSCVLWVPKGSLDAYKNADVWKDFQNIKELVHGDVNVDSEVNYGDLNALIDYVMGKDPKDFNTSLGDLNGDEVVDAADVVMQIDAIIKAGEYSKNRAPANVEVVDLGLPRGTMWANMNIGAESPEDYGLYFAWGETVGYTSDTSDGRSFDWASYKWMNEGESRGAQVNKYQIADGHTADCWYNELAEFIGDGKTKLDLEDDAAYVNWGTNWRMPTSSDFQELFENTTYKWTTLNGVNGLLLTSKTNDNTIFLPAAGDRLNSGFWDSSEYGCYWSSSLHVFDSSTASFLIFNWVNPNPTSMADRRCGFTIRPVLRNVP